MQNGDAAAGSIHKIYLKLKKMQRNLSIKIYFEDLVSKFSTPLGMH